MFFSKHPVQVLSLYASDGAELLTCTLNDYALPEQTVIELSILYYSDPEPCEIHRGAVTKRALLEIADLCRGGGQLPTDGLTPQQKTYFPENTAFISVTEIKK